MHKRAQIIGPILLLAALAGGGFWWWNQRVEAADASAELSGSGTIEAEEVLITAEIGGRIKSLAVEEGQEVAAGQTLAQLDTALLEAQIEQARAAVAVAEANLAQLRAGSRAEDIAAAQAQVDQARALRDGAATAYQHALEMLKNPQEIEAQVVQAQAARDAARRALDQVRAGSRAEDIAAADAALAQAQAQYAQAKNNWDRVQDKDVDPVNPKLCDDKGHCVPNKLNDTKREAYYTAYIQAEAAMHQAEQAVQQALVAAETAHQAEITGIQAAEAQAQSAESARAKLVNGATRENLATAQTALANAQRMLDTTLAIRHNPLQLEAAADAAKAQRDAAEAQLAQAQARLDLAHAGARPEQVQAAQAQIAQARAAQRQIEVQLGKAALSAPRAGVVLSRPLHEGEQANPGATIMTIGALDSVRLTLYIPETDIGRVRQGQKASVTVDSFPDKIFEGTITFIAQEAQFTPRNVQTRDERATTVFAVRVEMANPDHALKPGMPADAVIVERVNR